MRIEVRKGDIAKPPDLDAVVNAANAELWMGGGVAGALKHHGGGEIEREAKAQGPIPLGEAVVTGAGKLPNRFVVHAAAMGYQKARDSGPSSTGRGGARLRGFPLEECPTVMVGAARACATSAPASVIERVVFVVRDDRAERDFGDAIARG